MDLFNHDQKEIRTLACHQKLIIPMPETLTNTGLHKFIPELALTNFKQSKSSEGRQLHFEEIFLFLFLNSKIYIHLVGLEPLTTVHPILIDGGHLS